LVGELRTGTPAVFVDRPPRGVDAASVVVDNPRGARRAAAHQRDLGHRRIGALFHLTGLHTSDRRRDGFLEAYAARGLTADPVLLAADVGSDEQATAVVHKLLDVSDPPTAFFAARNSLAAGAVRALVERGLRRTVALVGFDDFPTADLLDPPLTVIRQDVRRIGQTVADMLFTRIGGDTGPPRHVVIEPTLVRRGSGEIPPP
ncbi:MAG: substrate-binding domain-containing protein, partial [Phycicoccus sp.]